MMLKTVLTLAALSGLVACGSSQAKTTNLLDEIHAYNDGVRWRQYPKAAARIHPKERSAFIEEINALEEELKISDWELIHIDYGGKKDKATVLVRYTWHLDSKGIVHTTSTRQIWKLHGKKWLVTEELRTRGEEMPGIDEPEEDNDGEETPPAAEDGEAAEADSQPGQGAAKSGRGELSLRHMMFEFR